MAAAPDNVVEMKGIRLSFDGKTILGDLDLDLAKRQRLIVMGSSGSGKSTILRLIVGILRPDAGTVRVHGREITRLRRSHLDGLRRRMGMVYQNGALISSMTVRENLLLPLEELSGKGKDEMESIVDEKLEWVGMRDSKDLLPAELSGGMRRRAGLARALVLEPSLLLFDEPTAGLDPVNTTLVNDLIVDLTEKTGVSSIVVTHEMDSAFRVGTAMAMLHEGRIIEKGDPAAFRRSQNPVVRQFLIGSSEGPLSEESDAPKKK